MTITPAVTPCSALSPGQPISFSNIKAVFTFTTSLQSLAGTTCFDINGIAYVVPSSAISFSFFYGKYATNPTISTNSGGQPSGSQPIGSGFPNCGGGTGGNTFICSEIGSCAC